MLQAMLVYSSVGGALAAIMIRLHTRVCSKYDQITHTRMLEAMLVMMLLFIGTHSVTTTLNVHSRGRSFVGAIDLRGLAPSVRLFRRPNTNGMKK